MLPVRLGAPRGGPFTLVELECLDLVHYFHVRSPARTVTDGASLNPRRNQRAIRCFSCIEVPAVLLHVLDVQNIDVTCRADRRVW